jgi:hypothetical protein
MKMKTRRSLYQRRFAAENMLKHIRFFFKLAHSRFLSIAPLP